MMNTTLNTHNLRKDVVSKEMLDKKDLYRIVLNKENKVFIDLSYKAEGRGVYIKKDINSVITAQKKNLFARSLKSKIDLSIYDELIKLINE